MYAWINNANKRGITYRPKWGKGIEKKRRKFVDLIQGHVSVLNQIIISLNLDILILLFYCFNLMLFAEFCEILVVVVITECF